MHPICRSQFCAFDCIKPNAIGSFIPVLELSCRSRIVIGFGPLRFCLHIGQFECRFRLMAILKFCGDWIQMVGSVLGGITLGLRSLRVCFAIDVVVTCFL
ncbi:hypothetical protein Nepgr_033576 [Nepenthes gracilis]|uniref:Uncharacterized protein n=1 Tax=Nepenthes gracilis TaxID=150966 RepID=A0AAD3TLP7_NEPGR|nr:hypothetical protein Nepgr_033576 [Nepenthes gracilis]